MAAFFFDVCNTAGYFWDEQAMECAGRSAIEAHARDLLTIAAAYHDGGTYPVAVIVSNECHTPVLTAISLADGPNFIWNWPSWDAPRR